jgi:NAD(P)-dependent dehydrogenase (short-subunit alcohol dehydrogenase family)
MTAIVTGAASGIGRQCCRELLDDGWRVFALDLAASPLHTLEAEIEDKARLDVLACDVSHPASVGETFATIAGQISELDALICSAGVLRMGPLMDMSVADFDQVFAVNARGPWLCAKAALPMLRRGASPERPGRIVILGSIASLRPKIGGGAYAASKAALSRLVRVLAVELAAQNILVNAVAPGTVDTPMIAAAAAGTTYKPSGRSPLGRVAQPADVVAVIRLLLRPEANYVTGTWIPVDGGTSAAFVSPG